MVVAHRKNEPHTRSSGRDEGHQDVDSEGANPHVLYQYANGKIARLVGLPTQ